VPFKDATLIFADPRMVLILDRVGEDGEQRWHAVGYGLGIRPMLLVVHAYRSSCDGKEIIRIISARKASKGDIRRYFE
jgi:uncharacterized DUF497 family protein